MEKFMKSKKGMIFMSLVATLLWGSAFPAVKSCYQVLQITSDQTKVLFAGFRFMFAAFMILLFIVRVEKRSPKVELPFAVCLGVIHTFLQYLFYHIGLGHASGIKASIIQASPAFLILLLMHLLRKEEKLTKREVIAVFCGFIGIILCNVTQKLDITFRLKGEGFLFLSALFSALGSVYVKIKKTTMKAQDVTFAQMFFGSILLIIVGFLIHIEPIQWNIKGFLLFSYTAFLSAAAFVIWYALLRLHKASKVSMFQLFIPIFGSMLSVLFLKGEHFTQNTLLGLVFVVLGVYIINQGGVHETR